ncbi:glycosyl hydrolase [Chitinophaga sp.]|uniref:glycosyl hydrolase n=1 Tax=Chitinophaga sp. TaxID=1869181 RepID=UPI0031D7BFB0
MKNYWILLLLLFCQLSYAQQIDPGLFAHPPASAGVRCWWWWLNGNVTRESITLDLKAMKAKGFSGACIVDAGGQNQRDNGNVPEGPMFGSAEWVALFQHAVKEAHRLGLELSMNIQSGWNLGAPDVTPQESTKHITWSDTTLTGNKIIQVQLATPPTRQGFYRDIAVLAFPWRDTAGIHPLKDLRKKAAFEEAGFSAADTRYLLKNDVVGKPNAWHAEVRDITRFMDHAGRLKWKAPAGKWVIMRFGYTNNGAHISTASGKWQGLVIDYMNADHFDRYWNTHVKPLLDGIGADAGTTLRYLQTDSWELGGINWTENFRKEFQARRGYDLLPYLPVVAGKIIDSPDSSNQFLNDFRKTIGDLVSDYHYKVFKEHAAKYGIGIGPECSGPHVGFFDGLKNYGHSDIMMSEFWAPSAHRPDPDSRFFVKQAASAAHIYNKQLVGAESFTTIGKHWNDVIWHDMKSSFDHEVCAGLNLVFLHTFTSSPASMGEPGQEYFAGTHFNRHITWWPFADAFFNYMARVQYMMQQGRFVADVVYYYGDHVPNIARNKESDPAHVLPYNDYDVINEEQLMKLELKNGLLELPGGMRYRKLVVPDDYKLSPAVQQKVNALQTNVTLTPDFIGENINWIHHQQDSIDYYFVSNRADTATHVQASFRITGRQPEYWDPVTGEIHQISAFRQKGGTTSMPLSFAPYGAYFVVFRKPVNGNGKAGTNNAVFLPKDTLKNSWQVQFKNIPAKTFTKLESWTNSTDPAVKYYSGAATYQQSFNWNATSSDSMYIDLGDIQDVGIAQVLLNGKDLGIVWTPPFRVPVKLNKGKNDLQITVINSWRNRLVGDRGLPEAQRTTNTNIFIRPDWNLLPAGLLGPVVIGCLTDQ